MADQELLDDFLEALEEAGSPAKNLQLRQALGWDEAQYEAVKTELVSRGIVKRGRGRSDTVSLVGAEPAKASGNGHKPSRNGRAKAVEAKDKSLESWIWDAACSIRGAKDAPKYKDYILPLIFTKRLCDVFDDELNRIAQAVGSRQKAFQLVQADHKLVRCSPCWRRLSGWDDRRRFTCNGRQTGLQTTGAPLGLQAGCALGLAGHPAHAPEVGLLLHQRPPALQQRSAQPRSRAVGLRDRA
jgi:hypothetical protein